MDGEAGIRKTGSAASPGTQAAPRRDGVPEEPLLPSFRTLDRFLRATGARLTQGISPIAVLAAWADWAANLAQAPGRQMELSARAQLLALRYALWCRSIVQSATMNWRR